MAQACKLLIVENELLATADLATGLRDLGYDVIATTSTREEALRLAGTLRPDLVLMDVELRDGMDGIHAAEVIHDVWKIPVVFVTANSERGVIERAKAAGPFGFLTRPFRMDELHATILIALHQHRLTRNLFAEHGWFSTLLRTLSDGVIATDPEGHITYINPAAERMTGWTMAEAHGRVMEDVYTLQQLDGQPVAQSQLRRALVRLRSMPKQLFLLRRQDGTEVPVEDSAAPIVLEGKLVGAVTIFVDATERVRTEDEQREIKSHLELLIQYTGEELGQTREELRALSAHLLTAQDQERSRIARDLHDDFSQQTALMGLQLSTILNDAHEIGDGTRGQLLTLAEQIQSLSTSLRAFSHRLHPAILEDLGLAVALEAMAKEWRQRGMDLSLAVYDAPAELPHDISTALYRITQEALTNASRHAAGAPVLVTLGMEDGEVVLRVEDAGPGLLKDAVRGKGLGLLNMKERAHLIGGVLHISAEPEQGTAILVRVPLEDAVTSVTR